MVRISSQGNVNTVVKVGQMMIGRRRRRKEKKMKVKGHHQNGELMMKGKILEVTTGDV